MTRKKYVADGYVYLKKEVVLDKKGRRIDKAYVARVVKAAEAVRPVGRVSITRDTAAALDRDRLKGALAGPECARRGAMLVDEVDVP